jgi:ABC-type nickel/cobalt efflux system permease component RcnA
MVEAMFNNRPLLLALLFSCSLATPASYAHPMGNFSVNHYSRITLTGNAIEILYILDLAEIPTYQQMQQSGITANADDPKLLGFVAEQGAQLGRGLHVVLNGSPIPLQLVSKNVIFPPGAGGLPTMKLGFVYRLTYSSGSKDTAAHLAFDDGNFAGHAGWKEIIVTAPQGMLISTSAPTRDRSAELSNYPTDLLSSPPQDLSASIQFKLPPSSEVIDGPRISSAKHPSLASGGLNCSTCERRKNSVAIGGASQAARKLHHRIPTASPTARAPHQMAAAQSMNLKANLQATPRSRFTELITTRHINFWFFVMGALIAFGLGALHALEPGHGKTVVAAYLVGSRGTARHAALLGIIVTASHTAGVFTLGAITLCASRYIVPEQLYPWLGISSGLVIAGLGGYMFLLRWTGQNADHTHTSGQPHRHWFLAKKNLTDVATPSPVARNGAEGRSISLSQLFLLGITGGIIPCPAALVVLLSAFALHRVGLGLFLIVAFSLGLAGVLIGFGMLIVYARHLIARLKLDGPLTTRWLPVASAAFMTILGIGMTVQALATTGLHIHFLSNAQLGPFVFVSGLGLILGMRHSTDPDHVVAVSTIVSRQRSIRNAALIGTFWGVGHTLTIFAVGCLIILFGVVIPARVGLSMEFSVALMLIGLGVLNLTGLMRKITERLSNVPTLRDPNLSTTRVSMVTRTESFLDHAINRMGIFQCVRPLVIGIVHGLAGSAAVALLVLSTIHNPIWASGYLLIFGAGTMLGMMCMTTAMAIPLAYAGNRFTHIGRCLGIASGLVSLCFGAFLVYQLGFVGGLFTAHPQWTPR